MIVIAALADDEGFAEDAIVEVNCGLNAVSKAEPITLPDGTKRYFISVPGTGAAVQFVVKNENDQPVQAGTLPFNGTTCIGTLDKPYVLSTKHDGEEGDYYDLSGRPTTITNSRGHKVYVTKGKKVAK